MAIRINRKLAIGVAAAAAAAGAGGAFAASQSSSTNPRQAFLDDVAHRLHVTPAQLRSALRGAAQDQRKAGVFPGPGGRFFGPPPGLPGAPGGFVGPPGAPGGPPGGPGGRVFEVAAHYLGLTEAQLFDQLRAGKSLAQVAEAHGKTVSGLESAIAAAAKARLDRAVAAKVLTRAQEQKILSRLSSIVDRKVKRPGLGPRFAPGQRPRFAPGQQPRFAPGQQPRFAPGQQPRFPPPRWFYRPRAVPRGAAP